MRLLTRFTMVCLVAILCIGIVFLVSDSTIPTVNGAPSHNDVYLPILRNDPTPTPTQTPIPPTPTRIPSPTPTPDPTPTPVPTHNFQPLRTFDEGHTDYITIARWSPDRRLIASGSNDMTVRIWDTANGQLLHTFEGHRQRVRALSWSSDSTKVVSISRDRLIMAWDAISGQHLQTMSEDLSSPRSVDMSSNGDRVISGHEDRTARIWDVTSGQLLHTLDGHMGWVRGVEWSPDDITVLSGDHNHNVYIWDSQSGEQLRHIDTAFAEVLSSSPDRSKIVQGSETSVVITDIVSGERLLSLDLPFNNENIRDVIWSPDGTKVAALGDSYGRRIAVWDATTGQLLQTIEWLDIWIDAISWSSLGMELISEDSNHRIQTWLSP